MAGERIRIGTSEAFDYDDADKEAVVLHLKEEYRRWWERTRQDLNPYADYAFGEAAWLAANGIEPAGEETH